MIVNKPFAAFLTSHQSSLAWQASALLSSFLLQSYIFCLSFSSPAIPIFHLHRKQKQQTSFGHALFFESQWCTPSPIVGLLMSLPPTPPWMARKRPGQLAVLHKAVACHLAYPMPCLLKESFLEAHARYAARTKPPSIPPHHMLRLTNSHWSLAPPVTLWIISST